MVHPSVVAVVAVAVDTAGLAVNQVSDRPLFQADSSEAVVVAVAAAVDILEETPTASRSRSVLGVVAAVADQGAVAVPVVYKAFQDEASVLDASSDFHSVAVHVHSVVAVAVDEAPLSCLTLSRCLLSMKLLDIEYVRHSMSQLKSIKTAEAFTKFLS